MAKVERVNVEDLYHEGTEEYRDLFVMDAIYGLFYMTLGKKETQKESFYSSLVSLVKPYIQGRKCPCDGAVGLHHASISK